MPVSVAINGFGRTGAPHPRRPRAGRRHRVGRDQRPDGVAASRTAAHDSVYGRFPGTVEALDGAIRVDGVEIPVFAEPDPAALPWESSVSEVVIESSGRFRTRADAARHLEAGARKVIISAPAKEPDVTVALGVNFDEVYDPDATTSSPTPPARRTASPRSPRCSTTRSASARRHDDGPRLHGRPAAAGRAAQGPAAGRARQRSTSCPPRPAPPRRSGSSSRSSRAACRASRSASDPTVSLVDLTIEVEPATRSRP